MKAVLISIQPKWCELIVSGKKTIEIRKTKPKIDEPFKAYIYCTKARKYFSCHGGMYEAEDTLFRLPTGEIKCDDPFELIVDFEGQYDKNNFLNGKVIGEFVCDKITPLYNVATTPWKLLAGNVHEQAKKLVHNACLTEEEIYKYANGKNCYALHINDLKIYDKPKELYEFYRKCEKLKCESCEHLKYQRVNSSEYDYDCEYVNGHIPITRAPQSWCYVEELNCE